MNGDPRQDPSSPGKDARTLGCARGALAGLLRRARKGGRQRSEEGRHPEIWPAPASRSSDLDGHRRALALFDAAKADSVVLCRSCCPFSPRSEIDRAESGHVFLGDPTFGLRAHLSGTPTSCGSPLERPPQLLKRRHAGRQPHKRRGGGMPNPCRHSRARNHPTPCG